MKKLTVLCDNNTKIDHYVYAEPALSFLIETDEKKVLFDFGYSDVYVRNAEILNLDLNDVDMCVLSHGHNDHTGGMMHWTKKVPLICHPDCLHETVYEGVSIGSPLREEEIKEKFDVHLTKEPMWLSEHLCFLGEIPTLYDFEKRNPIGQKCCNGVWTEDLVMEDGALALKTEQGLWILTGCSHAGICSITQYAKTVMGVDQIAGIIGGFHLLECDEKLVKTIETLKSFDVHRLIPMHCVSLSSKFEMAKSFQIEEAYSGMMIEFEN